MTTEEITQQPDPGGQVPQDGGQPTTSAEAQQPDFESMYYDRVSKDFGTQVTKDTYGGFVEKLRKGPEPARSEHDWANQLIDSLKGKDAEQAREILRDMYLVNGTDWASVAKSDPEKLLKAGLRMEKPGFSDKAIDTLYRQRYGGLKTSADQYKDEEGNYTVDDPEGEAALASDTLADAIRDALGKLEGKRISFAQKKEASGGPSQEEIAMGLFRKYSESLKSEASSFKAGDGENIWKPGAKDVESLSSAEAFNAFYDKLFDPSTGEMNQRYIARIQVMEQFMKDGLPALLKAAGGKGKAEVVDLLSNNPPRDKNSAPVTGGKVADLSSMAHY